MRLAMQLPEKKRGGSANDGDPRDSMSAEVIDLASRNSFPAVAQRKTKSDMGGLLGGGAIILVLGALTLWGMNAARLDNGADEQAAAQQGAVKPATAPAEAPAPNRDDTSRAASPAKRADPAPAPVLARAPDADAATSSNPYNTPTIVFDASAMPAPAAGPATPGASTGNSAMDFASRIGGVGGGPAQAARTFDPQTTVTQGTLIPAVLETAIDTDVPGFVRAVVNQDVRSYDGTRVLVPRSSRLVGQYQSGLQAGQKRAYVIWTRLIRPDGVSVDLASPATDFSGKAGLPGEVDSHFFKRFGSAMLLSVIDGLTAIASGGSSIILGGGSSAAAKAVESDSKIGPTVRVRQGEPIRVFTARDLDFSRAPQL